MRLVFALLIALAAAALTACSLPNLGSNVQGADIERAVAVRIAAPEDL